MFAAVAAFFGGFATRSACHNMPCAARLAIKGRPFKLGFCIQSVSLNKDELPAKSSHRPFISVTVGDKVKQTELGDWSKEKDLWNFNEVITIEAVWEDEALICLSSSHQYDLGIAAVSLASHTVGEVCFPLSSLLMRFRMEDRDIDGIVYTTGTIPLDLVKDGRKVGRANIAFETKQAPPIQKAADGEGCYKFSRRSEEVTAARYA
mmetsp:Transcript_44070/g.104280  ORF Transcript_44070/g.104280 Transcript_44070/m.104280 type:complete len:206 (+) Transcript_44070:91-708(+)